jgi:hypothetical protein
VERLLFISDCCVDPICNLQLFIFEKYKILARIRIFQRKYLFAETEKATSESLPRKSKEAYENLQTLLIGKKKRSVTLVITEEAPIGVILQCQ